MEDSFLGKVGLSPFLFASFKAFENDEKSCLFLLKSSFCSQDIEIFVLTFLSCRKHGLIRKIRLIPKFMTSQPGQQTITIQIWPNISCSKSNHTVKEEKYFASKIMQKMR